MFRRGRNTVLLTISLLFFGFLFLGNTPAVHTTSTASIQANVESTLTALSKQIHYKHITTQISDDQELSFEVNEEEVLESDKHRKLLISTLQEYYFFLLPLEYTNNYALSSVNIYVSTVPIYLKNEVFRL